MSTRVWPLLAVALAFAAPVTAQSLAVDVAETAGVSSESIAAAGTQVRLSGEPVSRLRLSIEASWGARSRQGSDVFGTAFPYGNRVDLIEAWAEFTPGRRGPVRAIRAGRYRTPFGISAASDHGYVGFLRPPLIRYGGYFALSSGYLEHGVDLVVGAPRASVEMSVGRPADVGEVIRRPGTDGAARAQVAVGGLVAGVSGLATTPYLPERFARGRTRFLGADARWMARGVQLRGEWIAGRPFDGTTTTGGYLDALVHTRAMGPVTALARAERLDYDTPNLRFLLVTHRYTAGVRVRVARGLAVSAGLAHQAGQLTQRERTAIEIGATYVMRRDLRTQP